MLCFSRMTKGVFIMEKGLISVVVPVYKAEAFLDICVSSILAQTYTNIEIILVNDGSPDNSGLLCDTLAQNHDSVRVVHKENGGVSSARNAGIGVARGEFIAFVDSDDTIESDMYENLYNRMAESSADICVCGYNMIYDGYSRVECVPKIKTKLDSLQIWSAFVTNFRKYFTLFASPWNKLIKMSLLQGEAPGISKKIRFPEGIHIGEDAWFNADCITAAHNGVAFVNSVPYNYVLTNNSNSLSKKYSYDRGSELLQHLKEHMIAALPHRILEIEKLIMCQKHVNLIAIVHVNILSKQPSPYKIKLYNILTILRYSTNISEKISAILLYFLPSPLYRAAFRLYCTRSGLN